MGTDYAVVKDSRLHQSAGDKITLHFVRVAIGSNGKLVQFQAPAVRRWTATAVCRQIRHLEYSCIATCIADHVEIRVAALYVNTWRMDASMRNPLRLHHTPSGGYAILLCFKKL